MLRVKSCLNITMAVFALAGCADRPAAVPIALSSEHIVFPAATEPGKPQTLILAGDPTAEGLYTVRVRIPAGCRLPPHRHPDLRHVVVLAGQFRFGYGETCDEQAMVVLPPGSVFVEPPNQAHYAWAAQGEVVVQATGLGPSGTILIEKSSDPGARGPNP